MPSIYFKELVMPDDQYIKEKTVKTGFVLHDTAGSSNPINVVAGWNSTDEKIGAHNVIGGLGPNGETTYDGKIVKAFDSDYWAWHIGLKFAEDNTRKPKGFYDSTNISIEVCSWGALTKKGSKYFTYLNTEVPSSQVVDLGFDFRGARYFHAYSDAQLEALRTALIYHAKNHKFVIPKRVFTVDDFNHDVKKYGTQVISFHTNFRPTGKRDLSPQPKLIAMLNKLCA